MSDESDTPRTDAATHTGEGEEWQQADAYRLHELSKQLERELTAAQKDAERYRWLRNHPILQSHAEIDVRQFLFPRATWERIAYTELDSALDAAIAAEKSNPPA